MDMVSNMKTIIRTVLTVFFITSLSGCGYESNNTKSISSNCVVVDNLKVDNYFVQGINRLCFDKVPQKVFVVGANGAETLLAIGVPPEHIIVSASNSKLYPMRDTNAKLFERSNRCDNGNLNMEYMINLKPDLIVAEQCVFIKSRLKNTTFWNEHGINTMIPLNTNSPGKHFYQETVEKEMQFILDLGKVFRVEDNAKRIVDDTYKTIEYVNKKTVDIHKPHVMIVEFISNLVSYDNTKLVGNMVEHIGGKVNETPAVISFEHIIKEDPEVLFVVCSHADYGICIEKILQNKALRKLKCIKNKRVYSIPLRFTYGSQCRTSDGIKFLAERMYPNVNFNFKEVDL